MRYKKPFYSDTYKCYFKQVIKTTAQKHYEAGVKIYVLPSNCRFDGMWHHPMSIQKGEFERPFDCQINEFKYYNCNSEMGKYPIFFIKVENA